LYSPQKLGIAAIGLNPHLIANRRCAVNVHFACAAWWNGSAIVRSWSPAS